MTLLTLPDIPTGFTASISDSLSDTGMLAVVVAVLALPAVFWIIHRLKTLFPQPYGFGADQKGDFMLYRRGSRRYKKYADGSEGPDPRLG